METPEYNEFAKRLSRIMRRIERTMYVINRYGESGDPEFMKEQVNDVIEYTRKVNGFFEYIKEKGCSWEGFEKEYYERDDVKCEKKEETKPMKKDSDEE